MYTFAVWSRESSNSTRETERQSTSTRVERENDRSYRTYMYYIGGLVRDVRTYK